MSNYDWPADRAAKRDRKEQRAGYNSEVYGKTDTQLIEESRLSRRVVANLPAAGGGGGGVAPAPVNPDDGLITSDLPHVDRPFLWLPIGPSIVLHGQASNHPRVAGRVRSLAVSGDGTRIYAGTGSGGLWYSRDAGASWHPVGGWADNPDPVAGGAAASVFACGALLVRFGSGATAEADDEVIIGTGEALSSDTSGMPGQSVGGVGLLHAKGPGNWTIYEARWRRRGQMLRGTSINRIIEHPSGGNRLLLATTGGLWEATLAADPAGDTFQRVAGFPPNTPPASAANVVDVLLTKGAPDRLWASVQRRLPTVWSAAELWTLDLVTAGSVWQQLNLPNGLAGATVALASTAGSLPLYAVSGAARLWRITNDAAPSIRKVTGIPPKFLEPDTPAGGADDSSSSYNLAVTVHPDDSKTVVIAGAARLDDGDYSAEMFRLKIGGTDALPTATPTFAGSGIHPDVHALEWSGMSAATRQLWVGCDGGVFRRAVTPAGPLGVGEARNNGLATLQTGFVASHPRSEGHVISGLQDNGAIERVGDTVWRQFAGGDGGGLTYHPPVGYPPIGSPPPAVVPPKLNDHCATYQYINSDWNGLNATVSPPVRRIGTAAAKHETSENSSAKFYSGCAAIMSNGTAPRSRLAIGTNRVWFSENFGKTWRTLPSLMDHRASSPAGNLNKDVPLMTGANPSSDATVVQCRWADPDTLLVLCDRAVLRYKLTTDATGKATACAKGILLDRGGMPTVGTPAAAAALSAFPAVGTATDLAVHKAAGVTHPSFYVGMTGDPTEPPKAPLPAAPPPPPPPSPPPSSTGKKSSRSAAIPPTPAPIPVAPGDDPIVPKYETLWWFDGNGNWHPTALHSARKGTRAPVYAVLCDDKDPDIVYVATAAGVWKGRLTFSNGKPVWGWEPFVNGLPEASVHDLSIFSDSQVRVLRAAIASRGVWEVDLINANHKARTYLRVHPHDDRRRPTSLMVNPTRHHSSYRWDASPDVRVRRADKQPANMPPGEADLIDFHKTDGGRQTDLSMFPSAHAVRRGAMSVDVLLHHRDSRTLTPAETGVMLLWQEFPRIAKLNATSRVAQETAWASLPANFVAQAVALFTAVVGQGTGSVLGPQTAWVAPGSWHAATPANAPAGAIIGQPVSPIDVRTPRTVTFNLTTAGEKNSYIVVVAIVGSTLDPLGLPPAALGLRDLALTSSQVAATTIRLSD
ncbi:MAG: hypothetical protein ABIS03_00600 [Gemmatimonadaceae bacterium]